MLLWKMQSVAPIGACAPRCPSSRTAALLGGSRPCVLKVFARQRVEKHPVGHRVLLPRSASTRLLPPQVEVFGQALQDHLAGLDVLSRGSGRRRRPHRRPRWPHGGSAAAQAAQGLGAQEAAVADRGICESPRRLSRRGRAMAPNASESSESSRSRRRSPRLHRQRPRLSIRTFVCGTHQGEDDQTGAMPTRRSRRHRTTSPWAPADGCRMADHPSSSHLCLARIRRPMKAAWNTSPLSATSTCVLQSHACGRPCRTKVLRCCSSPSPKMMPHLGLEPTVVNCASADLRQRLEPTWGAPTGRELGTCS